MTEKCANCDVNADYIVKHVASATQYFCTGHLPKIYKAEHAQLIAAMEIGMPIVEEEPKPAKKKAVAKPAPETEPEAVAEEVAPTEE